MKNEFDFDDDNSSHGLEEDKYDSDDDRINSLIKKRLNNKQDIYMRKVTADFNNYTFERASKTITSDL